MADITRGFIQELQNDPLSFFLFPQKDKHIITFKLVCNLICILFTENP